MADDNPSFYTVSGAAKRLRVNEATFRHWMDKGLINFVCLIDRSKKRKFLIKQEAINDILVESIVQAALERAYYQEWQEWQHEGYRECRDYEQDAIGIDESELDIEY